MDREGHDDEIRRSRRQKIVNSSKMQIREKRKTEFHAAGSEPTEFCKYQKFSSLTTSERKSSELSDNIKRDLVLRESCVTLFFEKAVNEASSDQQFIVAQTGKMVAKLSESVGSLKTRSIIKRSDTEHSCTSSGG